MRESAHVVGETFHAYSCTVPTDRQASRLVLGVVGCRWRRVFLGEGGGARPGVPFTSSNGQLSEIEEV